MELNHPRPVFRAHSDLRVRKLGEHVSKLMGTRSFQNPYIAQTVRTRLGPVRHALSQMVVAGVMTHQPAIVIKVETPPQPPG